MKKTAYFAITVASNSGKKSYAFRMRSDENLWSILCGILTNSDGSPLCSIEWVSPVDTREHATLLAEIWNEAWKSMGELWENAPLPCRVIA